MSIEGNLKTLREAIFYGELGEAMEAIKLAVDSQTDAAHILKDAVIPAISDIGNSMAEGDFFMPEVKISAKVLNALAGILKPYVLAQKNLDEIEVPPWTGEGDIDDIGAYLMTTMEVNLNRPAKEHMGTLQMIATGLDTHEFTPCKIQGTEAAEKLIL